MCLVCSTPLFTLKLILSIGASLPVTPPILAATIFNVSVSEGSLLRTLILSHSSVIATYSNNS